MALHLGSPSGPTRILFLDERTGWSVEFQDVCYRRAAMAHVSRRIPRVCKRRGREGYENYESS